MFVCVISISLINCKSKIEQQPYAMSSASVEIENPEIAIKEVVSGQQEVNSDFQKFVREAEEKIRISEQEIKNLKTHFVQTNDNSKSANLLKVFELEKGNKVLKLKLDDYIQNGSGNWHTFRTEFYSELKKLELASSKA